MVYEMAEFETLATFVTHPDHHNLFRSKQLVRLWARTYPMIFDEDDLRIAESQSDMGYHFHEWLAAVLLYHTYGYFSLIEKYEFKAHKHKQRLLRDLLELNVVEFIHDHPEFGNVQCPDLLVYKPDHSDWFFCEVKGPTDRLREVQIQFFHKLMGLSGKDILLVEFIHLAKEYRAR